MKRERLDCPYDFTSRCTMGRCDCKPKQETNKIIEQTTEEFAIEFAKWLCEKAEIPHIVGKMHTTLEIFKQEKGL